MSDGILPQSQCDSNPSINQKEMDIKYLTRKNERWHLDGFNLRDQLEASMKTLLYILFLAGAAVSQSIIDLGNKNWTLAGLNITVPGSVPSQAHLDLFAAGAIGDPLYGENDTELLWVQRSNWTYSAVIFNMCVTTFGRGKMAHFSSQLIIGAKPRIFQHGLYLMVLTPLPLSKFVINLLEIRTTSSANGTSM
jgi:hypothetical protein